MTETNTLEKTVEHSLAKFKRHIDQRLKENLPDLTDDPLIQAMHYSVLNGGKRMRPLLVYATAMSFGNNLRQADPAAVAVELIHAYSLIHDDLPAMDNSPLRRGKATCHIKFNEAIAILAGDALQTLAFKVLIQNEDYKQSPMAKLWMLNILAENSGINGMAGGQAIDLTSGQQNMTLAELEDMHMKKTGALIEASILLGALSQNVYKEEILIKLSDLAKHLGIAFQIKDDILDVEQDQVTLGKPQGADQENNKTTYPSLLGLNEAKKLLQQHFNQAVDILTELKLTDTLLMELATYIIQRQY